MTQFLVVVGKHNSGKTNAIRLFLEDRKVYLPKKPKDFRIILPITKNNHEFQCGVASGGDTDEILDRNLAFFENHMKDLEIVVMAVRDRPALIERLTARIGTFIRIDVKRSTRSTEEQLGAKYRSIADRIWQAFPDTHAR